MEYPTYILDVHDRPFTIKEGTYIQGHKGKKTARPMQAYLKWGLIVQILHYVIVVIRIFPSYIYWLYFRFHCDFCGKGGALRPNMVKHQERCVQLKNANTGMMSYYFLF